MHAWVRIILILIIAGASLSAAAEEGCLEVLGSSTLSYHVRDLAVDGDIALLLERFSSVDIVDLSNPSFPEVVGSWDDPAYLRAIDVQNDHAFVAGGGGLVILDISDPTSPFEISRLREVGDAAELTVQDGIVYVTTYSSPDLFVVDVSTPAEPIVLGRVPISPYHSASGEMHASNGMLYVFHSGIQVIDVTDPSAPEVVTVIEVESFTDFAVVDDRLYVVFDFGIAAPMAPGNGKLNPWGLLKIYDVTQPDAPQLMADISLEHGCSGVLVVDERAFLGTTWELYMVDVGDPTLPELIAEFDGFGIWEGSMLWSSGPTLVATQADELRVADITDCLPGSTVSTLMGAAETQGLNGTRWTTELSICNLSVEPASGIVDVYLRNSSSVVRRLPLDLEARTCTASAELEEAWLGTAAVLRLVFSGAGVAARARISNSTEEGSFGFFRTDIPASRAADSDHPAVLAPITQSTQVDEGFRTNIDLFNLDDELAEVSIDVFRSDGELAGSVALTLPGRVYLQVNNVAAEAGAGELTRGIAVVRTTTPGVRILVGASVIDNRSGDASSPPAEVLR